VHQLKKPDKFFIGIGQAISELQGATEAWSSQFYLQPDISEHIRP